MRNVADFAPQSLQRKPLVGAGGAGSAGSESEPLIMNHPTAAAAIASNTKMSVVLILVPPRAL